MIYFDKETLRLLKYICKHKGVSEKTLIQKFGDDISDTLILFVQEQYVLAKDDDGEWCRHDKPPFHSSYRFTYFSTPKGNELIETKIFNFRKWFIPLTISIVSMMISVASLVSSQFGEQKYKCNCHYCNQYNVADSYPE